MDINDKLLGCCSWCGRSIVDIYLMCICHFWENVSIQFNLFNGTFYPIFLSRFICLKYSWIAARGRAGFAISRNCSRSRQISVKSAFCFRYFSCFRSLSNRPFNYKNILIAAENITRKRLQGKICVDCFICIMKMLCDCVCVHNCNTNTVHT